MRVFACAVCLAAVVFGPNAHGSPTQLAPGIVLQNQDVLDLLNAGFSPEIIVAKIENSQCSFDTSPGALIQLKEKGVPDRVMLAMITAPVTQGEPTVPAPRIPEKTKETREPPQPSSARPAPKTPPTTPKTVFPDATSPDGAWIGPNGETIPLESEKEIGEFLLTAGVAKQEEIGTGWKVLLEQNGVSLHALFRTVFKDGREEAVFECAAYELSRLLGLHIVPPTVPRKIGGVDGSLQVSVEGAVTEERRRREGIKPPDKWRWTFQSRLVLVFDNLINNKDRKLTDYFYSKDWRIFLNDHTRCFGPQDELPDPKVIRYCEQTLFRRLQELDRPLLDQHLGKFLTSGQINALLKRRDLLVQHIEQLIEKHGARRVLFTLSG